MRTQVRDNVLCDHAAKGEAGVVCDNSEEVIDISHEAAQGRAVSFMEEFVVVPN